MYSVIIGVVVVCSFVHGNPMRNSQSRSKRQTADLWLDHLKTILALNNNAVDYTKCGNVIGCGLLDVVDSGKKKRSSSHKEIVPERINKIEIDNLKRVFDNKPAADGKKFFNQQIPFTSKAEIRQLSKNVDKFSKHFPVNNKDILNNSVVGHDSTEYKLSR